MNVKNINFTMIGIDIIREVNGKYRELNMINLATGKQLNHAPIIQIISEEKEIMGVTK